MKVQVSQVFIFLFGLSFFSSALRPDGESKINGHVEVGLTPRGQGYADPANRSADVEETDADRANAKALASLVARTDKLMEKMQVLKETQPPFSHDEFHAALADDSKPLPDHMKPSALFQEGSGSYTELFDSKKVTFTKTRAQGQRLRGVLDFYGYAFAIDMDRQKWRKEHRKKWFGGLFTGKKDETDGNKKKGEWWEAIGELNFKLLRYPDEEEKQHSAGRGRTAFNQKRKGEVSLQQKLGEGFTGTVELRGWWNDATMHFRGKAEKFLSGDETIAWLLHAYLPWERLDMRWDDEGAQCRFDYKVERETNHNNWFSRQWAKTKDGVLGKTSKFGIFRLDAVDAKEDVARVFSGMGLLRDMLYTTTLRLDQCKEGSQGEKDVRCPLEMRPISVIHNMMHGKIDEEAMAEKFNAPPFGGSEGGPLFTYIGVKAYVDMYFTPNGAGHYTGTHQSSICWGESPCPSVAKDNFDAMFLKKEVVLHQHPVAGDPGKDQTIFLYPIFDDHAMQSDPDLMNLQKFTSNVKSIPPMAAASLEDGGKESGGHVAKKQQEKIKKMQEQLSAKNDEIKKLERQMDACKPRDDERVPKEHHEGSDRLEPEERQVTPGRETDSSSGSSEGSGDSWADETPSPTDKKQPNGRDIQAVEKDLGDANRKLKKIQAESD